MKKSLLAILLLLVGFVTPAWADDPAVYLSTGKANQAAKSSGYTATWKLQLADDATKTWTVKNFNNNNNSWDLIKCGSKSSASTASVATDFSISEKISSVVVNMLVTSANATSLNSVKLEVSSSADFATDATTTYDAADFRPTSATDVTISITDPIENGYYRVSFDCAKSANGFCSVNSFSYYAAPEEKAVATPAFTYGGEGDTGFNVDIACATEGASIYYTLDGEDPTAESNPYNGTIVLTDPVTVKAIAILGTESSNIAKYTNNKYFRSDFSDLIALDDVPTSGYGTVIKGAITAVYQRSSNLYVKAGNSYMLVYGSFSQTFENGDTFDRLAGTYKLYNQLPEITDPEIGTVTTGGTPVEPIVVTDLSTIGKNDVNSYVKLEGISIENTTITDAAGHTIELYKKFNDITVPTSGSNLTLVGFVNNNKGTLQVFPVEDVLEAVTLGELTGSTGKTEIAEDAEIEVTEGDTLTFSAANAESIKVYDNSDTPAVEITDNVTFDADTYTLTWTPAAAEMRIITVEASLADDTKSLNFYLTVAPKPTGLGEIVIATPEDAQYDADNNLYTLNIGDTVTFTADNAEKITITGIDNTTLSVDANTAEWTATEAKLYNLTVVATKGDEQKSVNLNAQVNFSLTGSLADGSEIVDGETYAVSSGDKLTFVAKNAESIKVELDGDEVASQDGDELVYNAQYTESTQHIIVTATYGSATVQLSFSLTVTKQTVVTPVVTFDANIQDWVSYKANTYVTWTSDIDGLTFSTIASAEGTNPTYPTINGGVLKVYGSNGNVIEINAPTGYKMAKMLFTIDTANSSGNIPTINNNECTAVATTESSKQKAASVWADYEYTFSEPVASCDLAPSLSSKNLQIKSVAITLNMIETGIITVNTDDADSNAEPIYYNLQGIRVKGDQPGLYIRCQGSKVDKVILH